MLDFLNKSPDVRLNLTAVTLTNLTPPFLNSGPARVVARQPAHSPHISPPTTDRQHPIHINWRSTVEIDHVSDCQTEVSALQDVRPGRGMHSRAVRSMCSSFMSCRQRHGSHYYCESHSLSVA